MGFHNCNHDVPVVNAEIRGLFATELSLCVTPWCQIPILNFGETFQLSLEGSCVQFRPKRRLRANLSPLEVQIRYVGLRNPGQIDLDVSPIELLDLVKTNSKRS